MNNQQTEQFHNAISALDKNTMSTLLNQGFDINKPDANGQSYLSHVCNASVVPVEICELFISHKADVNYIDNKGNNALHYTRQLDKVKLLVDNNIDLNLVNSENRVALENNIKNGRFDIAQYLINVGADHNLVNWDNVPEGSKDKLVLPEKDAQLELGKHKAKM